MHLRLHRMTRNHLKNQMWTLIQNSLAHWYTLLPNPSPFPYHQVDVRASHKYHRSRPVQAYHQEDACLHPLRTTPYHPVLMVPSHHRPRSRWKTWLVDKKARHPNASHRLYPNINNWRNQRTLIQQGVVELTIHNNDLLLELCGGLVVVRCAVVQVTEVTIHLDWIMVYEFFYSSSMSSSYKNKNKNCYRNYHFKKSKLEFCVPPIISHFYGKMVQISECEDDAFMTDFGPYVSPDRRLK
jgi:hypothetical protein